MTYFNKNELMDIWCNLNCDKWDNRLGEKPDWYIRRERNKEKDQKKHQKKHRVEDDMMFDLMRRIVSHIPEKELLEYWNVDYQKIMTSEEFEIWWINCGLFSCEQIFDIHPFDPEER